MASYGLPQEKEDTYEWNPSGVEPLYVEEIIDNKKVIYKTEELLNSAEKKMRDRALAAIRHAKSRSASRYGMACISIVRSRECLMKRPFRCALLPFSSERERKLQVIPENEVVAFFSFCLH